MRSSRARSRHVPDAPVSLRARSRRWPHLRLALIACWRAPQLDRELADGASPDASALHALREQRITSRGYRSRVADGLARAVRDARASSRGLSAAVRPDRREVLAAATVLTAIDDRLRGFEPVTGQGVALLQSLLTEPDSPLYLRGECGALGSRLRAAAAALEPRGRRVASPAAVQQVHR